MHPAEGTPLPQSQSHIAMFANDDSRRPAFVRYFGLRENPFRTTSDPRYLLLTNQTRQALDGILAGVQARAGLLVLTGEVGAGKTVLLNSLLDALRHRGIPRAFIFNSHLDTDDLFEMALADFGAPRDPAVNTKPVMRLQRWLLDSYRENSNAVLIVDEAQGLKLEVLEAIRMLLNMEPAGEKLLQVILSGQPEFDTKINLPELRQLRQRVAGRYRLGALSLEETFLYIEHRLRVAGCTSECPFEAESLAAIHYYARGTPRVINALCEQALMKACAERTKPVPPKTIEEVAFQFQVDGNKPVGAPVQLGDLMMMNAIAARSKRANAMIEVSLSAAPLEAAAQPEPQIPEPPVGQNAMVAESIQLPIQPVDIAKVIADIVKVNDAAAPPIESVLAAPEPAQLVVDVRVAPAAPETTPTPSSEAGTSALEPVELRAVSKPREPAPASAPARPINAHVAVAPKRVPDIRGTAAWTPAAPTTKTVASSPLAAPKTSRPLAHSHSKTQISLLASLLSIERVATNWLRWLREPIGSNRGGLSRGKSR